MNKWLFKFKIIMWNFMSVLRDILQDVTECKQTVIDDGNVHGKLVTGDGFFSLAISVGNQKCGEDSDTTETKCEDKKQEENMQKCRSIREEFTKYVATLDDAIFKAACASFKDGFVKEIQEVVNSDTDPDKAQKVVNEFKDACNAAIMKQVAKLKSQMV